MRKQLSEARKYKVRSQDYTKSASPLVDTLGRATSSQRILQVSGKSVGRRVKKYIDCAATQTCRLTELDEL